MKRIGGTRASAALRISEKAEYVVALTGTPIPNSYQDIYNLIHILFPTECDAYFGFTPQYLAKPSPLEVKHINAALQPFFCRTNKDSLGVPKASPDQICPIQASATENAILNAIKEQYRANPLALIIRCLQLESDPSMLLTSLNSDEYEGILDGEDLSVTDTPLANESLARLIATAPITSKTNQAIALADSLASQGKATIIWCFFVKSMNNLSSALTRLGYSTSVICGATPQEDRDRILNEFRSRKIQILITNPHTLAESVSLHKTCHDAIYFEYSYNLVHLLQSKDRIHRLGLPANQYTQYHFLQTHFSTAEGSWSLDERIYARLSEKEKTMLEAIDKGILEIGSIDKDDLAAVFDGLFDPPLDLGK